MFVAAGLRHAPCVRCLERPGLERVCIPESRKSCGFCIRRHESCISIPKTKELHEFMWLRVAIYAHFQLGEETPELLARLEESRNNLLASLGRKRAQPFAARPSRRRQPDPPDTSATTAKVSKPLTRGPRELELIGVFIPPLQTHVARQGNNQSHPHQESRDSSLSPSIGKAPSPEPSSDPSSDSNSSSGNSSNGDSNSMCFMSDSPSVIEDVDFS